MPQFWQYDITKKYDGSKASQSATSDVVALAQQIASETLKDLVPVVGTVFSGLVGEHSHRWIAVVVC